MSNWYSILKTAQHVTGLAPNGKQIPFGMPKHRDMRSKKIVFVDPTKIEPYWKNDPSNYVERGNRNEKKGRIDNFGNWFNGNQIYHRNEQPVHPPEAYFNGNAITMDEGRHRYNWFKENGWKSIPLLVENDSAETFEKMFGTNQINHQQ